MNDYSLAMLVGKLTKDPELKYTTPGGEPYVKMEIAIKREVPQCDGTRKAEVSLIEVVVRRRLAELCAQFMKRGRSIMVVGSIHTSRWTTKAGEEKSKIQVTADRVQFLDAKPMEADKKPTAGAGGDLKMEVCRKCGKLYHGAGDGWDGMCGNCADRAEAGKEDGK